MRNKCLWLTPRRLWDFLTAAGTDKDIHWKCDLSLTAAASVAEMLFVGALAIAHAVPWGNAVQMVPGGILWWTERRVSSHKLGASAWPVSDLKGDLGT